jgi:hypothetical protein
MNLTSKPLAAIIFVVFFGGIAFSAAMGWWVTESAKQPAAYTEGEFVGQSNPADIRGSYTFGDVENAFGVPSKVLAQAFLIESNSPSTFAIKGLEEIYAANEFEIGTGSVRLFVAFYNGLPIDLTADTYLPENAAALLQDRDLNAEQNAYLKTHTIPNPGNPAPEVAPTTEPSQSAAPAETSVENLIKGKTTFQEILDWGVSPAMIEQVIGAPMPSPLTKIKDYCIEKGLDFETVKATLQAEIDK